MRPRYDSDYRTLFWALVLFPALPACAYAWPATLPWLLPAAAYLSYSAGVVTHNHVHVPVFRAAWANHVYELWLSIFYGCPVAFWIPTHLEHHHRFLDGPEDVTRTSRRSLKHDLQQALVYSLACGHWQRPLIQSYIRRVYARRGRHWAAVRNQCFALVFGQLAWLGLALVLHGPRLGLLLYAGAVGLPALAAPTLMLFTNYIQHVHCDHTSAHDHSRNFVGRASNWLVFDAGYHTVHHERPSVHWSRYAQLHRELAPSMHPSLNQRSVLDFCLKTYVLGAFDARHRTEPLGRLSPPVPSPPTSAAVAEAVASTS